MMFCKSVNKNSHNSRSNENVKKGLLQCCGGMVTSYVDLVVKLVVGAKHDEAAPRNSQAEKHLLSCFAPHGEVGQLVPFGDEQEL